MDTKTRIEEVIEGLEYAAKFIPFSRSRNAKTDPKLNDLSLNWEITIQKYNVKLTTFYTQGIGYAPSYTQGAYLSVDYVDSLKYEAEKGRRCLNLDRLNPGGQWIEKPDIKDVLYSLVMDSDVLYHDCFENWALELDFNPDSKTAENIYQDCLQNALKMRHMFGDSGLEELREYFQDY